MRLGDLPVHFASPEQAEGLRGDPSLRVAEIAARVESKEDLFREMARVLEFPDSFAHNWDAVSDCLGDLDLDEPLALVVHNALTKWIKVPEEMTTLVEVWTDVAASRDGDVHLVFVV